MLELIRRCKYCNREMMDVSPESYVENPFCNQCLDERVSAAAGKFGPCEFKLIDGYMVRVPIKKPA